MKRIYRYILNAEETPQTVAIPLGSVLVASKVNIHGSEIVLWLEHQTSAFCSKCEFKIFGTGHEIPNSMTHVTSWANGPFIWHLYSSKDLK